MRHLLFFVGINLIVGSLNAQSIYWAKRATGNDLDEGNAIAIDDLGNTYIAGSYESATLVFDLITITNSLASASDIFVAKFDPSGNCLWAKTVGGSGDDYATTITVNKSSGDVYVAGDFNSSSINFASQSISNIDWNDLILLKFSSSGAELWGKSIGGDSDEEATGLSIDLNENIYLTGYTFSSTLDFGSETITNNGYVDLFISKFNSSGVNIWAKSAGGYDSDRASAIVTDASGNSFITGSFDSPTINFGTTTLTNSTSDYQLFVAKYDSNGSVLWATYYAATAGSTTGNSLALDQTGKLLVAGSYDGSSVTFSNVLTNALPGSDNIFLAKLDASGNAIWGVNPISGPEANDAYCLTVDPTGNSFISGWFTSPSINFGGISLNSSAFGDNIFLAKYNSSGIIQNAYVFKGTGFSGGYGNAICSDPSGNTYLTGYFEGSNMTFGSTTLLNTGSWDVYWTKVGIGSALIDESEKNSLLIFPNPSDGTFCVMPVKGFDKTLHVINGAGQKVYSKHLDHEVDETIDLDIPSGTYVIVLEGEAGSYFEKLLIE